MIRRLIVAIVVVLTFSIQPNAQEVSLGGKVCWPLHFAGITVGINNDSQVVRLLGKGLFLKNHVDTGSRIFVDTKHSANLQVVFYTDYIAGDLIVSTGTGNLSQIEQKKAESPYFNPAEGFGNWHALHLGSTQEEVTKNLGEPESIGKDGGWRYLTNCSCEIQDYFIIYFKNGGIYKVVFSAPAG